MILAVREPAVRAYAASRRRRPPEPVIVRRDDPLFPRPLLEHAPPDQLWCLGNPELLSAEPMVAIVGTRNPTAYGERIARELAASVARAGGCVVSGMARGIDAAAHRGALDAGGPTIAVLGTGVDVVYPAAHRPLHAEIAASGLVISEMPPGQPAFKGCFPRRNRIIAGLSGVTVIVEAGFRSGALNTSEWARKFGREVAGVPGPIDSPLSAGVNLLIRDGAHMLTGIDDLATLAKFAYVPRPACEPASEDERAVYVALEGGELPPDVIAARTRLPIARCLAAVTSLELAGMVEASLGGTIRRR